jgi:very-short-patch-repair endonuclease
LLRPYRGVLVLPESADAWTTRALAAVLATDGVLSHTSALAVWRAAPEVLPLHVSIPVSRSALRSPGLTVHRVDDVRHDRLGPFPVSDLARALVDSWALAHGRAAPSRAAEGARAAVITCLRDRRVTVRRVREALAARPTLAGRGALEQLLQLVEQGCQSELEIWGVRHVLQGPGMPQFVQQYPVSLPFGTVHLDAAVPELKVAVEMDGMAFHDSPRARERDRQRDVALATRGWVALRFSYRRLTGDAAGCRREIQEVCQARRAQLGRPR